MGITLLVVATVICLVLSSFGDLRDRMIYTAPIIALHMIWGIYLWVSGMYSERFLVGFWIIQLIIYIALNALNVWGGGDSDLYMLLGDICLLFCNGAGPTMVAMTVCIALGVGLLISILVAGIEYTKKDEVMESDSSIAVAPGLSIVMIVFLFKVFIWMVIL